MHDTPTKTTADALGQAAKDSFTPAAATGPTTAHARDRIEHLVLSFPHGPGLVEVVDKILSASLPALSTEQLVDELGSRAGRSLLEAFKAPRS